MLVTPVFYLGAERSRFTIALQHRSCEIFSLFKRGLPRKLSLKCISAAWGCLKLNNTYFYPNRPKQR